MPRATARILPGGEEVGGAGDAGVVLAAAVGAVVDLGPAAVGGAEVGGGVAVGVGADGGGGAGGEVELVQQCERCVSVQRGGVDGGDPVAALGGCGFGRAADGPEGAWWRRAGRSSAAQGRNDPLTTPTRAPRRLHVSVQRGRVPVQEQGVADTEPTGEGGQDQHARVGVAQPRGGDVIDGVADQDTVEPAAVGPNRPGCWKVAVAGCAGVRGGGVEQGVEGGAVGEDEVGGAGRAGRGGARRGGAARCRSRRW